VSEPVIPEGLLGAAPPLAVVTPAPTAQQPPALDPDAVTFTPTPTAPQPDTPTTAADPSTIFREDTRLHQLAADAVPLFHL
jgi:hypothetical protein